MTFTGGGNPLTGPLGALTLTNPLPNLLVIHGGSSFTSISASGGAGGFELFPPMPTGWSIKDTAHGEQLQITVVDNTARNLSLAITEISTGNIIAVGALDQSGSGSITYSDGTTAAISAWTLAN